ncbi:MAG: zinc ribbon domain-containing protein, partial [Candidatus Hermodarchaeota archaeon]
WKVEINGNEYGDYSFTTNNIPNQIRLRSHSGTYESYNYFDAVGYSWDSNYNMGDNKEEGLLLSFENSTVLDWVGYSLDGQANRTILGNTTLPIPNYGAHYIQVFSNSTLGSLYESDIRYFSFQELNLITPENQTYTSPMSGYYPATYGFENDAVGTHPEDWAIIEGTGCSAQIIENEDTHSQVLELYDNGAGPGYSAEVQNLFTEQSYGSVEFWIKTSDVTDNTYFQLRSGTFPGVYIVVADDYFKYFDTTWNSICPAYDNTWYHIRIDFCCDDSGYNSLNPDKYYFILNGTSYGEYSFYQNLGFDSFNSSRIYTDGTKSGYSSYIDALGYSWDDNYNIGDNKEEGLLLSFENSTILDWMGYSLDGQTNRTILGNITIPIPGNGFHYIQIFANDTFGTLYESDIVYFTVNIADGIPSLPGGGNGGNGGSGGGGSDAELTQFLIISVIILSIALIATFSYIVRLKSRKKSKRDERYPPKLKKKKKPKAKKQRKKKKSDKVIEKGFILCPYCFNKTPSTAEFCSYCGTSLKDIKGKAKEFSEKEWERFFKEEVDIMDIKDKQVIVNILNIKGEDSQKIEGYLKKIFKNEGERELVRSEISQLPTGTFNEFVKSYQKLMKQLGQKKPEFDYNNDNYFNEGKRK